ncbi:reverse transcriptase [Phytophthora megakarya]|uniref:Reverse transcriptase n=1 Tax=Phytophthora megakarya TaxID=4795 RepID=A0A225VQE9_9STRA|nr:reverse transcriptase [Phytophthora megakarya]
MEPSQRAGTAPKPRQKKFFDFVRRDKGDLTAMTTLQAKLKPKRVRFADETSVTEDVTQREEVNGVPTEDSARLEAEFSRVTAPNGDTPVLPDAEDVPPNGPKRTSKKDRDCSGRGVVVSEFEDSSPRRRTNPNRDAWKMSDHFGLSEDNVLYYVGTRPLRSDQQQEDAVMRLVVPSTMIQEVLQNCHESLEGGHQGIRVKLDYYWIGLYADVAKHVRSCPDCTSSKSRPTIRGYSPGNILAERPFQVISMDFVIPLPKSRRGNTALLLFQCAFTGYVMGKTIADTTVLRVAQALRSACTGDSVHPLSSDMTEINDS